MQNVIVLICNSNMFVPYVLTEVLMHKEQHYLIMSDIDNMVQFFNQIHLDNANILKYTSATKHTVFSSRRELVKSIEGYNIQKIIFFHAEFGGIINWFIYKNRKVIPIYYCKIFNSLPYKKASLKKRIKGKIIQYILNGVDVDILEKGDGIVPSLSNKFFRKIKVQSYKITINYKLINEVLSSIFTETNLSADIVLCTGSTVSANYVKEEEYIEKIDKLIDCIGYDNIVAKCHPRFNDVFSKELSLRTIPSYIPGNLVIGYYSVFIANHSTLLVEAAIEGKLAISLVDYMQQQIAVRDIKAFYDNRLEGRGIIYYPKNLSELKELIATKCQKQ